MPLLAKKTSPVREYELTYLVGTGYTTTELNLVQDAIVTLIGKNGGEILETLDWGKKPLAYVIKKDGKAYQEALYTHIRLTLPADQVASLSKNIDFKREIIRSLLIVKK